MSSSCPAARGEDNDEQLIELSASDAFAIGPGHDSWVIGDEAYVALHFQGASDYAKKGELRAAGPGETTA